MEYKIWYKVLTLKAEKNMALKTPQVYVSNRQ